MGNKDKVMRNYLKVCIIRIVKKKGYKKSEIENIMSVESRKISGVTMRCQNCEMYLNGPRDELRFIAEMGVGNSTGLGFGMIAPIIS